MDHVWIRQSVIDYIFRNGREWLPKETGGILIGYCTADGGFVITGHVGTGEKAFHGLTGFKPDQVFHQNEIRRIYRETDRLETHLGDWHTHPNAHPYLSPRDKAAFQIIAHHKPARLVHPLMLIASPPGEEVGVWIYKKPTRFEKNETYKKGKLIIFE